MVADLDSSISWYPLINLCHLIGKGPAAVQAVAGFWESMGAASLRIPRPLLCPSHPNPSTTQALAGDYPASDAIPDDVAV
jgi:hypothetical protein